MMGRKWGTCAWSSYHTLGLNISGTHAINKEKVQQLLIM
jgi:hypothetical protein